MEVPGIDGQYNVVIKEENDCVVLLHYEDESRADHCEQKIDYETFSKLTSITNNQNDGTNPNENEVVITLHENSFPPSEPNYNTSMFTNHTDVETQNAVGIITESEGILLNEVLKQYHNQNVRSSDYMAYRLINNNPVNSTEGPGPDKPFKCPKCEKCFTQKPNLQRHMATHRGDKGYICPMCHKNFNQKANLQRHMRIHASEIDELPYFTCSECDYKCAQKSNLVRHKLIHSGVRKFACQECGTKFSQKVNLFKHMLLHTGERPFKCTMCEAGFVCKNDLIKHERKDHTGERPFPCTVCEKAFFIKGDMDRHFQSFHVDKSVYSCMLCPFAGKSEDGLEIHIMTKHTNEKPLKCSQCDFATARKSTLRNHSKLHKIVEGDKVRPMRICPLIECGYRTISKVDYLQHLRSHGISKDNSKKFQNVTIKIDEPKTIIIEEPKTFIKEEQNTLSLINF